jgi:16S rRNA (cytosine967-C5)-methyltransferase
MPHPATTKPKAHPQPYPRDLAVRVLTRVLSDHEPLDEALAALSGQITGAQRAWLQEVCSGTLRWKGRLDQAIDSTALKKKPSGWLRKILLVAAYQLVVQERTSPAAVVNETVNEIKRKEGEAPAKFANAALRKIADHAAQWRGLALRPQAKGAEAASWASLPEWLWEEAYARASLERPVTWIRARDAEAAAQFADGGAESGPVPGALMLTEGGAITGKQGFVEGQFIVQDISSQRLVAEIAGRVRSSSATGAVEGGEKKARALDLCAAPGGKSVGLAWSGLEVLASDRDPARYALLKSTVERAAPGLVGITERDKVAGLEPLDLVWVDSPCTGTGILRRHPDVRWLRREKELEGLLKVQQELLNEAWSKVRPGGWLAYSVCSVLKEEGPEAFGKFVELHPEAVRAGEWFLVPQEAPRGDGFWCGLARKRA